MIPLTLITGFLGAGKTTVLAHLLQQRAATAGHGSLAVIINEFAELGLDAVQLPVGDHQVWELSRGSIFCICLRTDFIALLERIVREINPDEIWVEATGIADVSELFKMLGVPTLRAALYLRTNICLIDPQTILKILPTLRAAGEQVTMADALVLNKTDTADDATLEAIEARLRALNPHAPLLRCVRGKIDLARIPSFDLPRLDPRASGGHAPQPISSVSITEPWRIAPDAFAAWCHALGDKLWRAKGRLGTPAGPVWIDVTLGQMAMKACPAQLNLPAATALAFVGPGLRKDDVRDGLRRLAQE